MIIRAKVRAENSFSFRRAFGRGTRCAAVFCASLLAVSIASAATTAISIDFGTTSTGAGDQSDVVSPTDTLGVVPVSGWNPIAPTSGTSSALTNNSGTATGGMLTLTAAGNFYNAYSGTTTPSGAMYRSYVDAGGAGSGNSTFAFSGLPTTFTLVNVYIYFDGSNAGNARVGAYTLTSGSFSLELYGMDAANATAGDGPYVNATSTMNSAATTAGNYVLFTNVPVTGNAFTIVANGDGYASDGVSRSPVNGLEIVSVPEPSTWAALLSSGLLLVAARRFRGRAA